MELLEALAKVERIKEFAWGLKEAGVGSVNMIGDRTMAEVNCDLLISLDKADCPLGVWTNDMADGRRMFCFEKELDGGITLRSFVFGVPRNGETAAAGKSIKPAEETVGGPGDGC